MAGNPTEVAILIVFIMSHGVDFQLKYGFLYKKLPILLTIRALNN